MEDKKVVVSATEDIKTIEIKLLTDFGRIICEMIASWEESAIAEFKNFAYALNSQCAKYSHIEQALINNVLSHDFIESFRKEEWFDKYLFSAPEEYRKICLFDTENFGGMIIGDEPGDLEYYSKRYRLTLERAQEIYNSFWFGVASFI